jgi:RNA polymerase sigma-70 factor (ECF subfamily)
MPKDQLFKFNSLYKKYFSPLTRFVFKKIGSNPDIAEVVIAETFEAAWVGYKTFKHKSSFFTWLCRIALNKIADYYKDQINRRSHIVVPTLKQLSQIESKDVAIDEKMALDELRQNVNKTLGLLPQNIRQLLWLKYWRDLSHKEISIILKITPRAVEGRLYRAKKMFSLFFNNTKG